MWKTSQWFYIQYIFHIFNFFNHYFAVSSSICLMKFTFYCQRLIYHSGLVFWYFQCYGLCFYSPASLCNNLPLRDNILNREKFRLGNVCSSQIILTGAHLPFSLGPSERRCSSCWNVSQSHRRIHRSPAHHDNAWVAHHHRHSADLSQPGRRPPTQISRRQTGCEVRRKSLKALTVINMETDTSGCRWFFKRFILIL